MSGNNLTEHELEQLKRFYFHSPEDVSASYVKWVEELQNQEGLTYGVPSLDKALLKLRPGNRLGVLARPGNAKTSFMAYMAQRTGSMIHEERMDLNQCIYYVTYDQQVEEVDTYFQTQQSYTAEQVLDGNVDMDIVVRNATRRLRLPIYSIGVSRRHRGFVRPPMPTINQVANLITDHRHEKKILPALIIFDYIQKVRVDGKHSDRTSAVTEAIFTASDLALQLDAPLIIGVQASRAADEQRVPIPHMGHAQWASALEQEMDRLISLWMPSRYYTKQERPEIEISGKEYENNEQLLIIRNLKQRFKRGFGLWGVRFDIDALTMHDITFGETIDLPNLGDPLDDDIPGF